MMDPTVVRPPTPMYTLGNPDYELFIDKLDNTNEYQISVHSLGIVERKEEKSVFNKVVANYSEFISTLSAIVNDTFVHNIGCKREVYYYAIEVANQMGSAPESSELVINEILGDVPIVDIPQQIDEKGAKDTTAILEVLSPSGLKDKKEVEVPREEVEMPIGVDVPIIEEDTDNRKRSSGDCLLSQAAKDKEVEIPEDML